MVEKDSMTYQNLGRSGVKVSSLSFGNWLTGKEADEEVQFQCFSAAIDQGVNFLDTAEIYGFGQAETVLGNVLKRGGWNRDELVISTKFLKSGMPLSKTGLGRKRMIQGMRNSLKRLQLDYVDVMFLHRFDQEVPLKETLWTVNHLIEKGRASYWGTSEFTAQQLMEAYKICDKYGYPYPIAEQCQYNMFVRDKVEVEYTELFDRFGLGTTIWSPLLGGLLTGKYNSGEIPAGSRVADPSLPPMVKARYEERLQDKEALVKTFNELAAVSAELGCSQAQLALAWCLKNKDVSTAITGATRAEQVLDNMKAVEFVDKLTPEHLERIETALGTRPTPPTNWRTWQPLPSRR